MNRKFNFSADLEDAGTTPADNGYQSNDSQAASPDIPSPMGVDDPMYIDAKQFFEQGADKLLKASRELSNAAASIQKNADLASEINRQRVEFANEINRQRAEFANLFKTLDKKAEIIEASATFKFHPSAIDSIKKAFNDNCNGLEKKMESLTDSFLDKGNAVIDRINVKDRRISMSRMTYWFSRIFNFILIGVLFYLLYIDLKTGITTEALWKAFGWTIGLLLGALAIPYVIAGFRND